MPDPATVPRNSATSPPHPEGERVNPMPDVQGSADARRVAIDKVGVKDIRYPITLHCPATGGSQSTVASVNMYVGLPHYQKGTHMSRFLEVLNKHHEAISSKDIKAVCRDMKDRLEAEEAHLELRFPYFIDKKAPVTGMPGKLDIEVTFEVTSNGHSGGESGGHSGGGSGGRFRGRFRGR